MCNYVYVHRFVTSNQRQKLAYFFIKQNKSIRQFLMPACGNRFLTGCMYFNQIIYVFRFKFIKILLEMLKRTSILRKYYIFGTNLRCFIGPDQRFVNQILPYAYREVIIIKLSGVCI